MELNKDILKAFSIKPKNIRKYKGVYIVDSINTTYKIRVIQLPESKILESQKIIKYLKSKNINTADEYILSESEVPYFIFRNETYVATKYVPLQKRDFSKNGDVLSTASFLSAFHNAVEHTDIEIFPQKNVVLTYKENINKLKSIKKLISKQNNYNEFDLCFIKNYNTFLDLMENTVNEIDNDFYNERLALNNSNKSIAHNNIKEENFEAYKGQIHVSNFTKIDVSDQLLDLSLLIQRHLKVRDNTETCFYDIINEYMKNKALSDEEIKIVKAFSMYPKRYVKTVLAYYDRNRSWTPTSLINKLNEENENQKINKYFFENL